MKLTGLHFLLSYKCTYACDHCFVFGSPWHTKALTYEEINSIMEQGKAIGTVNSIYFEGGEPFLFYPVMVKAINRAKELGFSTGIVTNAYWATTYEDALIWLKPLAGKVDYISMSADDYHGGTQSEILVINGRKAATELGLPMGVISIASEDDQKAASISGKLPEGESKVMFRGRAAQTLAEGLETHNWESFTDCPHEQLDDPGRIHIGPHGHLHVCQGITIGNVLEKPLAEIWAEYKPLENPITAMILNGGPAELFRRNKLESTKQYADACQLCFETRKEIRPRYPEYLTPIEMYEEIE